MLLYYALYHTKILLTGNLRDYFILISLPYRESLAEIPRNRNQEFSVVFCRVKPVFLCKSSLSKTYDKPVKMAPTFFHRRKKKSQEIPVSENKHQETEDYNNFCWIFTVQHMSPFKLSLKEAKLQIINGLIKSSAVTV